MSRCTCRIRVVNSWVTFHLAHILISRAHHAFHIVICKRVFMNMIAPFECVLIQHLNRPDAHTRVCERWWTFFHSSTFHVFINYRNLRSKIKNPARGSSAHMFSEFGTGLIVSRFLLRFELLIDLHGPLSPKSYRFLAIPSITGIWVYGSSI